jgi:hypothetical protein
MNQVENEQFISTGMDEPLTDQIYPVEYITILLKSTLILLILPKEIRLLKVG